MKFDNSSVNDTLFIIYDLSAYENNGSMYGNLNCTIENGGVYDNGCYFDGSGDYINLTINKSVFDDEFSISLWFKTNSSSPNPQRIINHYDNFGFDLYLNDTSLELIENKNILTKLNTTINLTDNLWNNVIIVFSNDTKYLYLNGILIGSNLRTMTTPNIDYMIIGSNNGTRDFFNGTLDEVGVYSKVLTGDEISNFYKERKAMLIDYKESLYGIAVEFD